MNVARRRGVRAGAIGLVVIGALCALAAYWGAFRTTGTPQESEWQRRYWGTIPKAETAFEAQDWVEAARLYGEVSDLLPDDPVSRYNRATALLHLGREDEALEELRLSVEFGWADIEGLRSEPVFHEIRGTSRFTRLIERVKEIADEPIVVYVPPGLDSDTPAPLVITFHGLGENPHRHIRSWKQAADRLAAVVVAPRGVGRVGAQDKVHSFRWVTADGRKDRKDFRRCKELLQRSLELCRARVHIDDSRIVLAGYSQGGSVALALLADAPGRFRGAVVQATSYSPRILKTWKRDDSGRKPRVYIIAHEFDRMRAMSEAAYHTMKEAGIDARLEIVRGTDHELPPDNGVRQIAAMRFVLGSD